MHFFWVLNFIARVERFIGMNLKYIVVVVFVGLWISLLICCNTEEDRLNVPPSQSYNISGTTSKKIRYLALGDSYTVGEGVASSLSWPYQLVDSLSKKNNYETTVQVIAETGFMVKDLKQALTQDLFDKPYNLISILIGVNDQFLGFSVDEFRSEFTDLINLIISKSTVSQTKIFVVSIPDWGSTPFGGNWDRNKVAKAIDAYNNVLKGVCQIQQIEYINITDISRIGPNDWALVAEDGLHPSGKMYGFWLERIFPRVLKILQR